MEVKRKDRTHTLEGGEGLAGHAHGICMGSKPKGLRRMGGTAKKAQGKAQCRGGGPQWRDRGGGIGAVDPGGEAVHRYQGANWEGGKGNKGDTMAAAP